MSIRSLPHLTFALLALVFGLTLAPAAQAQILPTCPDACTCTSSCNTECEERVVICFGKCEVEWVPSTCGNYGTCSGSASCQSAAATDEGDLDSLLFASCDVGEPETATPAVAL